MNYRKSSTDPDVDKLIFGFFDSKMSKIEAKYPYKMNITVVPDDPFEKRKARVINIIATACIALFFGLGALNYEPPRQLEKGIKNYYAYHDFENRIPVAMKKVRDFLDKYK